MIENKIQENSNIGINNEYIKSVNKTRDGIMYLGMDEAGNGEYMGVPVVSCLAANKSGLQELLKLGVVDSKCLSNAKIIETVRLIAKSGYSTAKILRITDCSLNSSGTFDSPKITKRELIKPKHKMNIVSPVIVVASVCFDEQCTYNRVVSRYCEIKSSRNNWRDSKAFQKYYPELGIDSDVISGFSSDEIFMWQYILAVKEVKEILSTNGIENKCEYILDNCAAIKRFQKNMREEFGAVLEKDQNILKKADATFIEVAGASIFSRYLHLCNCFRLNSRLGIPLIESKAIVDNQIKTGKMSADEAQKYKYDLASCASESPLKIAKFLHANTNLHLKHFSKIIFANTHKILNELEKIN